MNDGSDAKKKDNTMGETTKIQILPNGPMLVHGEMDIENSDGKNISKTATTAFCRCGASKNKPFCDGAHNKIEFKG
jgi:hypothetical protein